MERDRDPATGLVGHPVDPAAVGGRSVCEAVAETPDLRGAEDEELELVIAEMKKISDTRAYAAQETVGAAF